MPLQDHMNLVSVDDHLIEPPELWQQRLPARFRDRGPRVVETENGHHLWEYEGRRYPNIGLNAVAGRDPSEFGMEPVRFDDMIPGCYEVEARVRDMDVDGVQAQMCFPSFPRFAGTLFLEGEDMELALACVQVWNDFYIDEWCGSAPERFIPMAILPLWDMDLALAEFDRTVAKGARAISFPENPYTVGLASFHSREWGPLFGAAEKAGVPLTMHFGTSGKVPKTSPDAPVAVWISLMGLNSMQAMVDLMFSPVFHDHPELKVATAEGGIGWIPYILERADATWERHRFYQDINQEVSPSEVFSRNLWGCFISDEVGMALRNEIGVDKLTWESDYPHSDSHWPNSRKLVHETMVDVPDEDVHRIVELNARDLFQFHD